MKDHKSVTEIFRKLGADDPESWAASQINEGKNQLGRFVFLKQAWADVINENDLSWIDRLIEEASRHPREPFAGVGHALSNLEEAGVDRSIITDLVRGMQAELLFSLCYLLDDPGDLPEEVSELSWRLFQLDGDGRAIAPIEGLHESVLELDPTGREMRPRNS